MGCLFYEKNKTPTSSTNYDVSPLPDNKYGYIDKTGSYV